MTTMVGTQDNFADAIRELIELDFDAIKRTKLRSTELKTKKINYSYKILKKTTKDTS